MKTFAFGAAVGALVCFAIIRLTDPQVVQSPAPEQLLVGSVAPVTLETSQRSSCPDTDRKDSAPSVRTVTPGVDPKTAVERSAIGAATKIGTAANSRLSPGVPSAVGNGRISIEDISEKEATELCMRAHTLRQQRELAVKNAEPRDEAWAYSMEQLMRQHIESYIPADRYTKLQVECRTTFCELTMEGTSEEGRALGDKVALEIANQLWSDIAHKGQSGHSEGTTWRITHEWYRPRTESERRAWLRNRNPP